MASKNIFSDGYTQLPESWDPDSISLFAGGGGSEPWPSGTVVDARGMVETSRWVPSEEEEGARGVGVCVVFPVGVVAFPEEEKGERNQEKIPLELLAFGAVAEAGGDCVGWSSVEAQFGEEVGRGGLLLLVLVGAKGVDLGPLFLSHA